MLAVLAIAIAPLAGIGLYWYFAELPEGAGPVQFVEERVLAESPRRVVHIRLSERELGEIGFVVSLPDPIPAGRLPVILLLGGLGPGTKNISPVTNPGNNAIVGYDPSCLMSLGGVVSRRRIPLEVMYFSALLNQAI